MDGSRFDDLAKLVSTGAPRRSVLKGLFGAFVGVGAAGALRSSASAGGCALDDECGSGQICCNIVDGAGVCSDFECCGIDDIDRCLAGMVCEDDGFCVPICSVDGVTCETIDDCCEFLDCVAGFCEAVCEGQAEGGECTEDGNCCSGICCGGFCRDIECCINDDDPNARCDKGTTCFEGVCEVDCQGAGEGEDCAEDADCCAGICCAGACRNIECCIDEDDPNARCPEGSSCFEGVCDAVDSGGEEPEVEVPVTLPNTGIGDNTDNGTGMVGLGLAAGAAALIAAKKLRPVLESVGK